MSDRVIGVIGGSGLYQIDGMTGAEWRKIDSPWGEPSDELLFGELDGAKLVFLPRHGRGHRLSPTDINYRANIDALKRAGVTEVISVSACGSFREEMAAGRFCHCRSVHRPHGEPRKILLWCRPRRPCLSRLSDLPPPW